MWQEDSRKISRNQSFPAYYCDEALFSSFLNIHPAHAVTGSDGYFGKTGALSESMQRMNVDPRSEVIVFACRQVAHRPAAEGWSTPPD